jgi:membrane dipeptidase
MIRTSLSCFFVLVLAAFACSVEKSTTEMTDDELKAHAVELAQKCIIVDGHIDLPYLLTEKKYLVGVHSIDTIVNTGKGEFDHTRAVEGGLDAPFMSIYIPLSYQAHPDMGKGLADSLINSVEGIVRLLPDKFARANSPDEIEKNTKEGKISLPMVMENGAPIGNSLDNLKYFYDRGIRYITLTHNKDNQICDSSRDTTGTWGGLSPFGREVVAEMNNLGIMVRKLGENGGVIMINYFTAFLDTAVVNNNKKLNAILAEKKLKEDDSLARPIVEQFRKEHPVTTSVETVVDHIDNVVRVAGIDHVGIGSDFDGVDGNLPIGLEDVSTYPNLISALLKRGYSDEDIGKICSGNLLRVWRKVEEVARQTD